MPAPAAPGSAKSRAPVTDDAPRERVMRAAISLFAARGFNAIGIREIAAAAELRSSTLYYYFRNKDDLLVEIMLSTIRPLRDAGARIVAEIDDPVRCLAALVESHVWAHASDRMAMLVVDTEVRALSGERLSKVMQLRDEYEGIWRSVVRNGAKQDLFEAPQPEVAARALLQMTTGVSQTGRSACCEPTPANVPLAPPICICRSQVTTCSRDESPRSGPPGARPPPWRPSRCNRRPSVGTTPSAMR